MTTTLPRPTLLQSPDNPRKSNVLSRSAPSILVTIGAIMLIAGFAASGLAGFARVLLGGGGIVLLYTGSSRLLSKRFGPEFDLGKWLSVLWLAVIVLGAIFIGILPVPESVDTSKTVMEPMFGAPSSVHWLGTDQYGLDIFGQLFYGARISLIVGVGGIAIGGTIGTLLGLLASYFRGRIDGQVSWLVDLLLSFPPLVLLMGLAVALPPNPFTISLALGILVIPSFARLTRAVGMKVAQQPFVLMSRAVGATRRRIMFKEILPNVLQSLIPYSMLIMAVLIVAEASLSFLGLSIQRPQPTWGNMIAESESHFAQYPFLLAPAIPLFLTVFAVNRIGDSFRGRSAV